MTENAMQERVVLDAQEHVVVTRYPHPTRDRTITETACGRRVVHVPDGDGEAHPCPVCQPAEASEREFDLGGEA